MQFNIDVKDYNEKMNDIQRRIIDTILGFFIVGDGMIAENIIQKFRDASAFFSRSMAINYITAPFFRRQS